MASRRRAAWAGAGAGLGWLLTYSLNAVVFAYGALLVARDAPLAPLEREYHPGVMVTVSTIQSILGMFNATRYLNFILDQFPLSNFFAPNKIHTNKLKRRANMRNKEMKKKFNKININTRHVSITIIGLFSILR